MKALSYSQIALYRSCPLSYKIQYIDGLKPKERWYFSFGTTLHTCAEYFFKVKVPPPPSLDDILSFYEANWLSEGYESVEDEAKHKAYGRQILTDFWNIHNANFRVPIATEKMFYIDIEGVKLRGFIDRIDKLESGGLAIVDYKTNKELFSRDDLESNLQLTFYQLAAGQMWHLPVEKLTLYHLRSNTACDCQPRSESQLEEARDIVLEVAQNIAEKKFPAIEGQYCPCDFPEHCPYYMQQTMPETQDLLYGASADEAVERYVSLQRQIKELEFELDNIKQALSNYCQCQGLNRIFSKEHAITYKMVERAGYNEDEVRALLDPEGLWQQVLSLDNTKIKNIIADESVAKDIRSKLAGLRQVLSSSPRLWVRNLSEEE